MTSKQTENKISFNFNDRLFYNKFSFLADLDSANEGNCYSELEIYGFE